MAVVAPNTNTVALEASATILRETIQATARADPRRIAMRDTHREVSYAELAAALPAVAADRRRRTLASRGTAQDAVELVAGACAGHSVLMLDAGATRWEADRAQHVFEPQPTPEAPVLGLCTSGTNGVPKVVELDWWSVLANAASFADAAGYGPADVLWVTTPQAHLFGLGAGLLAGLLRGSTVMLCPGALGPGEFAQRLVDGGVTVLLSVPFLARHYLREFERDERLARSCRLRATIAAGEPVTEDLICGWRAATGTPLLAHYGLTEGGVLTLATGSGGEGVGRPLADVEVRIAAGGAVHVRRRAPARRFRVVGEEPESGGWCVTGDIGRLDSAGNLHITGRAGERINVAGKKVDPAEVEQALRRCEGVLDCAVAGLEGAKGAQVVAFVCLADGITDLALRERLSELLSSYKIPRRLVRCQEIPRTLTGKIRRGELIASLENGENASVTGRGR